MTGYQRQSAAIENALKVLDAAAYDACDGDDADDMTMFVDAARELRSAFNLPQPLYPVVLSMDDEDEAEEAAQ